MEACRAHPIERYYKWHARIYDATRWTFLFGRDKLVRLAAGAVAGEAGGKGLHVVEVGCGTGRNLAALAKALPAAKLTGIDMCRPMLCRAARSVAGEASRVTLSCAPYGRDSLPEASVDLVVFSYALSMFNPGYEAALDAARYHLRPGGMVAVVDFNASPAPWFRTWMGVNHVRLDGHLPPALAERFAIVQQTRRAVYGGLWDYFCCLGQVA